MERPKLGEDEDELLKFQEEFLASKAKPAATVVRKTEKRKSGETTRDVVQMDTLPATSPSLDPEPAKKSRFRASRDVKMAKQPDQSNQSQTEAPDLDPEEMLDSHDKGMAAVLSSIIERDTRNSAFTMPHGSKQAFPSVVKNTVVTEAGKTRQSLFSQQIACHGVQDFGIMVQQEADKMDTSDMDCGTGPSVHHPASHAVSKAPERSHIVDGRGLSASQAEEEAESIHKENLTKLAEMREEEILKEQQELLKILDPTLVAFLKSKAKPSSIAEDLPRPRSTKKRSKTAKQAKSKAVDVLPEAVPMEGAGKWVHMNKVEYDKLEWMKDLPPPSADDTKTGQQARFDFQGNVIPADADVPVNIGLHHHGDEPQRAGYSVGELFQLARSTNVQQRVLALTTLANVIQKAKDGSLDDLIQTPILPSILDGGIIFLLRWACDDSVDAVVAAAMSALCALACNPADEAALAVVSSWYQGQTVPALLPPATLQVMEQNSMEQDEDNTAEETDADVVKRDLIQALVSRMMLLERLFYILDTRKPQAPTVVSILSVLTRVARHSTQLAYEMSRKTKLMDLIFNQFLPTTWKSQDDLKGVSVVYGRPVAAAMRLVGGLCQAGRHIAASLTSTYSLHSVLIGYLAVGVEELPLSLLESESLQRESWITWRILLSYGLATEVFRTIYESIMEQMKSIVSRLPSLAQQPAAKDVCFVSALEGLLPAAAVPMLPSSFNQGEAAVTTESLTTSINWSHVEGLYPLIKLSTEQCLAHLAEHYTQQKPSLQFPAVCVNFLATYHSKQQGQSSLSAVEQLQQIEFFCGSSLVPFLKSWGFTSILGHLSASSNILRSLELKRREVASCLPEMGCDGNRDRVPVVGGSSPIGFLLALTRLLYTLCRVHRGVIEQTTSAILCHKDLLSYLRKVTSCPVNHLNSNYFTQSETLLHYFLIKLSAMMSSEDRPVMMHQLALDVVSRLQEGEEFLAHDLMSTILFNPDFILEGREEELAASSMAEMTISNAHFLKSATQEEVTTNNSQLLREGFKSLAMIRNHYFKAFAHMERKVAQSRNIFQQSPQEVSSLLSGNCESYLMPRDWVFLPLVELYNLSASAGSSTPGNVSSPAISMVASVLQWIFLLETWRSRSLSSVSVTLKVSRIMCVFLAGNDLFLEKSVYPYLASLFRCYTTPHLLNTLDFDEQVPGISSFYDLYMLFLDQYEAVSFGDPVFGAFVLLPMQQCQNCLLRRAVWQERSHLLRTLTVPVQEMLIDIHRYLSPDETDVQLLQLYARSLLGGAVRQRWSPVLFLVALHHFNHFLYYTQDENNQDLRQNLWDRVLRCQDESLRETIIRFKQVSTDAPACMELYPELPANRLTLLTHHRQRLALI